jgi:hypothetical protein
MWKAVDFLQTASQHNSTEKFAAVIGFGLWRLAS